MFNRTHPVVFTFAVLVLPGCAAELGEARAEEDLSTALQDLATSASCPPVKLLEPGTLSTPRDEGRIVFMADGKTAYFHVLDDRNVLTIMESRRSAGGWTAPVIAPFSGQYDDLDPWYSTDSRSPRRSDSIDK